MKGIIMKKSNCKVLALLHLLFMLFSLTGVCSKLAGKSDFLSPGFFFWYGAMIVIMGIYAVGWQQIIKHLPLSTAFANKAVTLIWSLIFGAIIFREHIKWTQIAGCMLAVIGVIIFVLPQRNEKQEEKEVTENDN